MSYIVGSAVGGAVSAYSFPESTEMKMKVKSHLMSDLFTSSATPYLLILSL